MASASLVWFNKEALKETTQNMRLGNLTPPVHSQIDITDGTNPKTLYPDTDWVEIGSGDYENVELSPTQLQKLGDAAEQDAETNLYAIHYVKWLRIS
jgi:hypothetical protein